MIEFSDIIVGTAYAQGAGAGGGSAGFGSFVPLILIFVIFYVLLIRPQQKKVKEHQQMIDSLKRNDKIITAGGVVGTISKVNSDNETFQVKISSGVEVTIIKSTVTEVVTRSLGSSGGEEKSEKKNKNKKNKK